MSINGPSKIVNDSSLVLSLDAGNIKSYIGSGTTWNDLTKKGNNGTLVNSPTYSTSNGGSIVLNGTTQYVTVANNILSGATYTKFAWFNTSAISGYSNNIISGGTSIGQHAFWLAGGNKLNSGHNGSWSTVQSTTSLVANAWYFGAVTFSNVSGWNLYLQGALEATNVSTTTFTGANPAGIQVGTYDSANNFIGNISAIGVYNRVLSSTEILKIYNATRRRFGL